MIENTIGSLLGLMAMVWLVTQMLKNVPLLNRVPQNLLALIVGELATVVMWQAGVVTLDGAMVLVESTGELVPRTDLWGYALAMLYGMFAVATAAKAHDTGSDPQTLVKRLKKGKPIE